MTTAQAHCDESELLVHEHMGLVRRLAQHLARRLPSTVQIEDLVQAGAMGLLEASQRYDESHGASFETFAGIRIRGAMLDELRRQEWSPRSSFRLMREIGAAVEAVEMRTGRTAAPPEVARELGVDLVGYFEMIRKSAPARFFDIDEMSDSEFEASCNSLDDTGDPACEYEDLSLGNAIEHAMERLPERERTVLALYYDGDLNFREIGKVMGVTESRICQIHKQASAKLRMRLAEWSIES